MAEWQEKYPVEYSAASDENIDSWVQKYISEINRLYLLLIVFGAMIQEPENLTILFRINFIWTTLQMFYI